LRDVTSQSQKERHYFRWSLISLPFLNARGVEY
jgi:hypothetical protein